MLPEDKRHPKDSIMLKNIDMNGIMGMALTNRNTVEYNQEEDPYMLNQENIVKITGKSKK